MLKLTEPPGLAYTMCTKSTSTKPLNPTVPPSLASSAYWELKAYVVIQMIKVSVPPCLPYWKWPDTTQTNVLNPIVPPRLASEQMGLTCMPRPMLLQPPCCNQWFYHPASTDAAATTLPQTTVQSPCLNQCCCNHPASTNVLHFRCFISSMYVCMYCMYLCMYVCHFMSCHVMSCHVCMYVCDVM